MSIKVKNHKIKCYLSVVRSGQEVDTDIIQFLRKKKIQYQG